ncbi:hypothetical protein V3C99_001211, partial [Haemonchus contortus]
APAPQSGFTSRFWQECKKPKPSYWKHTARTYSLTALVKDAPKSGRLMKLDLEVLLSNMEEDPYLTAREVAAMLGYNQSTVVRGPEQLGKLAKLGR